MAPSPCPGLPDGWGQDLSGSNSEFTYELQANGSEAGHLLNTVLLTSSANAAATRLIFRQSDASLACTEDAARAWLAGPAHVVSLSTTRAAMQTVEPAAMWRVKATLSKADGHQFILYLDEIRIVDGPYFVAMNVSGCGCLDANADPNPASGVVPGETQAILAMGHRLHDLLGH